MRLQWRVTRGVRLKRNRLDFALPYALISQAMGQLV